MLGTIVCNLDPLTAAALYKRVHDYCAGSAERRVTADAYEHICEYRSLDLI